MPRAGLHPSGGSGAGGGTPDAHATSHNDGGADEVTVAESQVTGLTAALAAKAPLASPTFTGNVVVPDADAATEAMNRQTADVRYPLQTNAKGFVNHGSTAGTARPTGYASVEWYGTVSPTNAIAGDTWNNPT